MTIPSCNYQKQDCQTNPVSIDKLTTENKTTFHSQCTNITAYFFNGFAKDLQKLIYKQTQDCTRSHKGCL